MLFDKQIEPCCAYCQRGTRISDDDVICVRRGIVPADGKCRKFVYDPFPREPERPVVLMPDRDHAERINLSLDTTTKG